MLADDSGFARLCEARQTRSRVHKHFKLLVVQRTARSPAVKRHVHLDLSRLLENLPAPYYKNPAQVLRLPHG